MTETRDGLWAHRQYESLRARLPRPARRGAMHHATDLSEVAGDFDLILLDAYGVLNRGEAPVPQAPARLAALRAAGKRLCVLTNSAGYPKRVMMARYARLGFDFTPEEVVSSREALLAGLPAEPRHWGLMLPQDHGLEDLGGISARFLQDDPADYEAAEGFLLVGSGDWTEARQALFEASLRQRPRPVLVGNPDLVAPREDGLSLEPGHFAHRLAEATGVIPEFYGKPFGNIFELALARLPDAPPPERILMVGDTPQTDILGAQAMGMAGALVLGHGLLTGFDAETLCTEAGIFPDFLLERT